MVPVMYERTDTQRGRSRQREGGTQCVEGDTKKETDTNRQAESFITGAY